MANSYRRFRFIKPYIKSETERIPEGSELTIMENRIYFEGGMITPAYYYLMLQLIKDYDEGKEPKYLKEVPIPYNKV